MTRNKRIRAFAWLFLGIVRDFWKEARIARRHGFAKARERMSARHRRRAIQFRDTALRLGGVLVKLGQFFSTRVDVMPKEYIEELAKLQDTVPAVPFEAVRQVIEEQFGRPLEEVFPHFEPQAWAAASLAQVHKAVLPDGRIAAVKIQRPGIDKLSDIDLATFSYLMEGLNRFTRIARQLDIPMIVSEFVRTIGDELDFVREGDNAVRFKKYFGDNKLIYVPEIYWDYTTEKVLTLEAIDGIKISDYKAIEAAGIDRKLVAQEIVEAYLKQVLEDGFFHADPHPGNLFVAPGPLITFIDFGMVGEITPPMRSAFRDTVIGVAQRDSNRIIEALWTLGFIRPGADVSSVKNAFDWLLDHYAGITAQTLTFAEIEEIQEDIMVIFREQPITIPAQFAFLGKTFGTVLGLATGLDPEIDIVEATKPYVARLAESLTEDKWGLVMDEAKAIGQLLLAMPRQMNELLEKASRGQLRVKIDSRDIANSLDRSSGSRFAWGASIFSAVVVLGGIWLIGMEMPNEGYAFAALGFLVFLFNYRR
ncbi:MAG: AarF/ABC1/UbiB kinase family protein [Actinomycetota bacterium]|nr:AarF/ABC1/UbiB kinase family protein [Actinomycetota bacterium]